jgi:hypothetical protein
MYVPVSVNQFALFMKQEYSKVARQMPHASKKEIMERVSALYKANKPSTPAPIKHIPTIQEEMLAEEYLSNLQI